MSNFSHQNCTHASSKAGRAKCRRDRQIFAAALTETLDAVSPVIETPAFEPVAVTRETWREFKTITVRLVVRSDFNDETHEYTGTITGWSEKMIQFKHAETGKTMRVMVSFTDTVETIEN